MENKDKFKNPVFLLGGHDLEMLEIMKILSLKEIHYYDKNLKWNNAFLSQYQDTFNKHDFFVGIELVADIPEPQHYILFDHHNQNAEKPSSIEQVAEFLGVTLTRYQQLVAANDKGYISAMEKMGATKQEINEIRSQDRKAQGVTEEDEKLAEMSIQKNLTSQNSIVIVKSLTSKFSTITDRLYPIERLLIYSDEALTYYGQHAKGIAQSFKHLIEEHKAYYGGGDNGYFGIAVQRFSSKELLQIKDTLISILTDLKE
jgi:hypothetical protein